MKILNLYAGIGGNRKLWGNEHEITAVEYRKDIAAVYSSYFPNDKIVIGDAHQYLLDHYKEFDFIWASPPCPTHSKINFSNGGRWPVKYPDMKLYQEIILLQNWFTGIWVVENVISYYNPLIQPQKSGRHYYWANFKIKDKDYKKYTNTKISKGRKQIIREAQIPELQTLHGFDLSETNISNKRQILRNCVIPELGLHILNSALGKYFSDNTTQLALI